MVHGLTPENLSFVLSPKQSEIHEYPTLHCHCYTEIRCHTTHFKTRFYHPLWKSGINCQSLGKNTLSFSYSNLKRFLRSYFRKCANPHLPWLLKNQLMDTRLRLKIWCSSMLMSTPAISDSPYCTFRRLKPDQHFLLDSARRHLS